jgi:hypothetical protein
MASAGRRIWAWVLEHRITSLLWIAVAALLIIGVPVVLDTIEGEGRAAEAQSAYAVAESAHEDAEQARGSAVEALEQLKSVRDAAYARTYAAVSGYADLFGVDGVTALGATLERGSALIARESDEAGTWSVASVHAVVTDQESVVEAFRRDPTYAEMRARIAESADQNRQDRDAYAGLVSSAAEISGRLASDIRTLANGAAHAKEPFIATVAARSSPETQAAMDAALAGLAQVADGTLDPADGATVGLFQAYIDAAMAAKSSHVAVIAAEEAARSADGEGHEASGSGSRGSGSSGTSGGDSEQVRGSGEGSRGGSAGSSGGDATAPSGGGSQPAPDRPRGQILRTGVPCSRDSGASGTIWANWMSSIVVPSDAVAVWVAWETPGVDWGVQYECVDTSDW